ncbi:flagellar hook-basal body complex protein FliE [bacterium]|nr:flagellar hook-basal body complex protein FliE [bacterium]
MNGINRVDFFNKNNIQPMRLNGQVSFEADNNVRNFKDVLSDMVSEVNEVANKPNQLTNDLMVGKADIHDVMASIAESDLTMQAVTTFSGKILQTYEKIMQIQI